MNLPELNRRIRDLEKDDKLDGMLASVDEGLPWSDFLWMLQFPAYIGIAIQVTRMGMAASESDDGPPPEQLAWLMLLVVIALALKFLHPLARNRMQRLRRRLRRRGVVAAAAIVQAHDQWLESDEWWPGTVLISFDVEAMKEPQRLVEAARSLFSLKHADRRELPEEHAGIAWSMYHEMGHLHTRPVPPDLTNGLARCYLATVDLPPEPLKLGEGYLALALEGVEDPAAVAMLPAEVR